MRFAERILINAAIDRVWNFLNDPIKVGRCIPGCERIVALDDGHYEATLKVKVGPISFSFTVDTRILDMKSPTYMSFESRGKEKAGAFTQKCELTLKARSREETELAYDAEVNIVGRLATFGERVFRGKAKQLGEEFVASLKSGILFTEGTSVDRPHSQTSVGGRDPP